jgi:hypothetical protein
MVLKGQLACLFIVFFIPMPLCCKAQNTDTISLGKTDTNSLNKPRVIALPLTDTSSIPDTTLKPVKFQPNPKKAGLFSAILPGAGQFYNRQYWKLPVIYGGLLIAGYFISDNLTNYISYRKAYIGSINNPYRTDPYVNIYTTDQLQQLQDDYSKFLDMSILFTGIGYIAQILDAVAYAHLHNFDMSEDLSIRIKPVVYPQGAGLGLVVNFK